MNYSDYRFTLDIQLTQAQVSVPAKYGDSARRLCISLTDGRKPYIIGEGCFAVFNAELPDENKTPIKNYCVIENNTVIYEFTPNTTSCEGIVNCDITIYSADDRVLTSPRFVIVVDEAVVRDDEIPESEFTIFALARIEEANRQSNEYIRKNNEDSRNIGEYGRSDCRWNADQQCYVDSDGVEIPIDEIGGRVGAEFAREALIGDINTALDTIIAIQESLFLKTFKLNDGGSITTYRFEEGMTWGEWCVSEYNTDGFFCEGFGMVQDSHSKGYIHKTMEIDNVYQDDVIEEEYEYYLHW